MKTIFPFFALLLIVASFFLGRYSKEDNLETVKELQEQAYQFRQEKEKDLNDHRLFQDTITTQRQVMETLQRNTKRAEDLAEYNRLETISVKFKLTKLQRQADSVLCVLYPSSCR